MAKSFATLLAQIADADYQLLTEDLRSLSDLESQAVAELEQSWSTVSVHRRRELMRKLADFCQHNFEVDYGSVAQLGMADDDSLVRLAAIETFWDSENPKLIAPLLNLGHNDPDLMVRASSVQALGQFVMLGELGQIAPAPFEDLVDQLLVMIQDEEIAMLVRCRALESVAAATHHQVPDLIQAAYRSEEELFRISAVLAMGRTADDVWEPVVLAELESANPGMRYHAAQTAGQLELQAAVPQLIALLDDPDPQVLGAAIESLGAVGGREARHTLEALLEDEELGDLAEEALDAIDFSESMPSTLDLDL